MWSVQQSPYFYSVYGDNTLTHEEIFVQISWYKFLNLSLRSWSSLDINYKKR